MAKQRAKSNWPSPNRKGFKKGAQATKGGQAVSCDNPKSKCKTPGREARPVPDDYRHGKLKWVKETTKQRKRALHWCRGCQATYNSRLGSRTPPSDTGIGKVQSGTQDLPPPGPTFPDPPASTDPPPAPSPAAVDSFCPREVLCTQPNGAGPVRRVAMQGRQLIWWRYCRLLARLTEIRTLSQTQWRGQGGPRGWPNSGKPEFATGHRYCRSGYRWNRGRPPDVAASRPTIETGTVIRLILDGVYDFFKFSWD